MLFWQVIIFNTKTESTGQLCFAFFRGLWLIFFSCFLVFARKKLVHFPPTSHPLYQAEISVHDHPFKFLVLEKGEEKQLGFKIYMFIFFFF